MEGGKERMSLGKSLLVPSVKELAKECLERVPDRYVVVCPENDHDRPALHHDDDDDDDLEIPIINMEKLISGDEVELQRMHLACQQWGFFQLTNHGISSKLLEKFKLETQEFFNLPIEEKRRYWQSATDIEGFGQAFVVSEDQKLDWADMFYLTTIPKHLRRPHLLPMFPLPYRSTLETYSGEVEKLALKLLECMAKALSIDVDLLKGVFGEGNQSIRMTCYPPCPEPDKVIGLTPHSDAVALTIVLQLNHVDGLQIQKDGKWIPVRPLSDAFVVNIGDVLEILTNGLYRSILHRAVVHATKERLSVATFYTPANDREIGPIPNFITPDSPKKFITINMVDYWKGFYERALDGKSYLDCMRVDENNANHD